MGPSVVMKRSERGEKADSPVPQSKRQRVVRIDDDSQEDNKVGATELASAFALASLAALSPAGQSKNPTTTAIPNTENQINTNSEERSPKEDPVPISPEIRSPMRHAGFKKVTFAPGIKDVSRNLGRKYSFPPPSQQGQGSRMPPGFARVPTPVRATVPQWAWNRHRVAPQPVGFMPPRMTAGPPGPSPLQANPWVCDFCNVASFPTYEEACMHEESCRIRYSMALQRRPHSMMPPPTYMHTPHAMVPQAHIMPPPSPPTAYEIPSEAVSIDSRTWYEGSVSLAVPESDSDWLSELNCFIRAKCVEAFSASAEDVSKNSKRGRITVHQVGIRCCFCKNRCKEEKQGAAVSYPLSVAGIYESVKRWQRVHLELCEDVPDYVREKVNALATLNVWIPTTRQYWADSAKALGMMDTVEGIRFSIDPKSAEIRRDRNLGLQQIKSAPQDVSNNASTNEAKTDSSVVDGECIVYPEDMSIVPAYVFFLMRQVEGCHFTEADRFVARSKGPLGYAGFQCRHCNGHAGLGKYFPVSSKSLATNSTSQNIHAHLLKCRKTPPMIKEQLMALKDEKSKAPRLEPGWRKIFFDKIWARLHGSKA